MWKSIRKFTVKYRKAIIIAAILKLCFMFFMTPMFGISDEAVIITAMLIAGIIMVIVFWIFHVAFSNCKIAKDLTRGVEE